MYATNGASYVYTQSECGAVNITVNEKAPENPTLSDFSVTPTSVVEGESFSIIGTINGNGNKIIAVTVGVRNVANEQLGGNWDEASGISVDSFNLSSFGSLTTGGSFGNTTLTAGTYVVEVYVTTDSGMTFASRQQKNVTITAKEPSYVISVDTIDTTGSETVNSILMKGMLHISGDKTNCDVGFEYWTDSADRKQQNLNVARYDGETFEMSLTALQPDTEYSYRAYATYMKAGVWLYEYGETVTIRTKSTTEYLPVISSEDASNVTEYSATLNASLESTGGVETEYGFIISSTGSNVTTSEKIGSGTKAVDYRYDWTGLEPNHSYTYQAYATNEYGTVKGEAITFTTKEIQKIQLGTPQVSASSSTVEVGETFTVSWPKVDNATEYSVYVWDANGNEVKRSLEQTALSYSTVLDVAGAYTVGVYATNGASYVYTQSDCGAVNVTIVEPIIIEASITTLPITSDNIGINSITVSGQISFGTNEDASCYDLVGIQYGVYQSEWTATIGATLNVDGSFTATVTGLNPETTYAFRAVARTASTQTWLDNSNVETATTLAEPEKKVPAVQTNSVTDISATSATLNGTLIDDYGFSVTEWGFYWSTSALDFPIENGYTSNDPISFGRDATHTLNNLTPNTKYYYYFYAVNSEGESVRDVKEFTTLNDQPVAPIAVTMPVGTITANSAILNGKITSDGGAAITEWGYAWKESGDLDYHAERFTSAIAVNEEKAWTLSGLEANTEYEYYFYAVNSEGEHEGTVVKFTTLLDGACAHTGTYRDYNVWSAEGQQIAASWMGSEENVKYSENAENPAEYHNAAILHFRVCDKCGEAFDAVYGEAAPEKHSFSNGGVCSGCQYKCQHSQYKDEYTGRYRIEKIPGDNVYHNLAAVIYNRTCKICSATWQVEGDTDNKGKLPRKIKHAFDNDDYTYDASQHWLKDVSCNTNGCGYIRPDNTAAHTYDASGKCTVCPYVKTADKYEVHYTFFKKNESGTLTKAGDNSINVSITSDAEYYLTIGVNCTESGKVNWRQPGTGKGTGYKFVTKSDVVTFVNEAQCRLNKAGTASVNFVDPNGKVLTTFTINVTLVTGEYSMWYRFNSSNSADNKKAPAVLTYTSDEVVGRTLTLWGVSSKKWVQPNEHLQYETHINDPQDILSGFGKHAIEGTFTGEVGRATVSIYDTNTEKYICSVAIVVDVPSGKPNLGLPHAFEVYATYTDYYGGMKTEHISSSDGVLNIHSCHDIVPVEFAVYSISNFDEKLSLSHGQHGGRGDVKIEISGDIMWRSEKEHTCQLMLGKNNTSTATVKFYNNDGTGKYVIASIRLNVEREDVYKENYSLYSSNIQRSGNATAATVVADVSTGGSTLHFFAYDADQQKLLTIGSLGDFVLYVNGTEQKSPIVLRDGEYTVTLKYRGITVDELTLEVIRSHEELKKEYGEDDAGQRFEIEQSCVWINDDYDYIVGFESEFRWSSNPLNSTIDRECVAGTMAPSHILLLTSDDAIEFANLLASTSSQNAEKAAVEYIYNHIVDYGLDQLWGKTGAPIGSLIGASELDAIYEGAAKEYLKNLTPSTEEKEASDIVVGYLKNIFETIVPEAKLISEGDQLIDLVSEGMTAYRNDALAEAIRTHAEDGWGVSIVWGYDLNNKGTACAIQTTQGYWGAYEQWKGAGELYSWKYPFNTPKNEETGERMTGYIITDPDFVAQTSAESMDYLLDVDRLYTNTID